MRFERRFLFAISLSLAWGALVAGTFYVLAGRLRGGQQKSNLKQVVVATRLLPEGSVVSRDAVVLKGVPETLVPQGTFPRVEDVLDRPVIHEIQPGEPVMDARLAAKGSGAGLTPLIPPGMRAISVRANDVVGVAGFVLPGTRVDVLVTGAPPGGRDAETRTVLQNVTVLSAGQTIQNDGKNQPIVAPVVTLLVTPPEAEALTLANSEGHIQLLLRNSTDKATTVTPGRRLHELYSEPETLGSAPRREVVVRYARPAPAPTPAGVAPPAAAPLLPQTPHADEMVIIQGTTRRVEVFPAERKDK